MNKHFRNEATGAHFYLATGGTELIESRENHYAVVWARTDVQCIVDGTPLLLHAGQIACLTSLQRVRSGAGHLTMLGFNREFYCVQEQDREVSCIGVLFYGSAQIPVVTPGEHDRDKFDSLLRVLADEFDDSDAIQEEMLRVLLKRLIIRCTALVRRQLLDDRIDDRRLDIIRQFCLLVEMHFRRHHDVAFYARQLHKSPKTLANLFALYHRPSPRQIIHDRLLAEARKHLYFSDIAIKELAFTLGFSDSAHFSRFFCRLTGMSPSAFRDAQHSAHRE